jgi:hypothetical protein
VVILALLKLSNTKFGNLNLRGLHGKHAVQVKVKISLCLLRKALHWTELRSHLLALAAVHPVMIG